MTIQISAAYAAAAAVAVSALAVSAFAKDYTVVNIVNGAGEEEDNILGDGVSDLSGAVAIGVHFEVSEFEDYGKEFNVDINVSDNGGSNQANFTDAEGGIYAYGVTTEAAKVTGNGDYIAWAMFDEPIDVTDDFYMTLVTGIKAAAEAALEAGDVLPTIKVLDIGVQDGPATDEPSDEPTDELTTGDTTQTEEPGDDEPTTGDTTPTDEPTSTPDDTGKDDDNNNVNTGVTLAVVPAALAAAALVGAAVVTKKRK